MKKLVLIYLLAVVAAILAFAAALLGGGAGGLGRPLVLVWHVSGSLPEQAAVAFPFAGQAEDSMAALYPALRAAREDRRVRGFAVFFDDARLGLAKAQELRAQLVALRAAGKLVECYLDTAGESTNGTLPYFLASACGRITLAPVGEVNLLGLDAQSVFLRGALDKLKIRPDFLRVGAYKSAPETFTETHPSPASQQEMAAVLDGFFGQIVAAIAEARHLPEARVRQLVDGAPYTAEEALHLGLIDALAYPDDFRQEVRRHAGSARLLSLADYHRPPASGRGAIAIVVVAGTIERGRADPWASGELARSDDVAELLAQVGRDDSVPAVVLRIDSPGGSPVGSELMLHAIERLQRRKPVVVSMSGAAASGGYYIASRAGKIVAQPATLTGSIGVWTGKLVTRGLEEEILGIHRDELLRGADANIYSSLTPFSPPQQAKVEHQIDAIYRTFVGHVAAGRHMSRQAVEAIAGGRVWTGADAKRLGLVDELGGLDRAIELARAAAHLAPGAPLGIHFYPEPSSWLALWRGRARAPLAGALPAPLLRLVASLEAPRRRALELPPEWVDLERPF